jgi:glycosyltransferase involved in cell wall biosynthesis
MTVHGAKIEEKDFITWLLNRAYHPFAQYILGNMDMLMTQGEKERTRLLHHFKLSPDKVIVVPNGIWIPKFNPDKEANEDFIEKYHLKEDSFKILYVSRLVDAKNPEKIISAVRDNMKNQNIEVILIGEGSSEYITKLKKISDKRVHILGEVRFEDLVAAYHVSDLFVFLGLWEGMPTVIMEAMLCGLPILTTSVAGIPDIITEGENGLFVKIPIDEKDLANKISYFMNEADLNKMSEANIEKVKTQYNWDIVANKILDVYNEVLEEYR